HRQAVEAPVGEVVLDEPIDFRPAAGDEADEDVGIEAVPGRHPPRDLLQDGDDRILAGAARIPSVECLHRPTASAAAFLHPSRRSYRLAISSAASAESHPLLPAFEPALSSACSRVSVVSTPKTTGTSAAAARVATPLVTPLDT